MNLFLSLIAGFALTTMIHGLWANRTLVYGWVIPSVAVLFWLVAFALCVYEVIPLWLFMVLTVVAGPLAGAVGSLLLILTIGWRKFVAWRLTGLTIKAFSDLIRTCRSCPNKEAASNALKEANCSMVFFRASSPFFRECLRPSDAEYEAAQNQAAQNLTKPTSGQRLEADMWNVNNAAIEFYKRLDQADMAPLLS